MSNKNITHVDFVLNMFSTNRKKAIDLFIEFINVPNAEVCLDIDDKPRITDEEARVIISHLCMIRSSIDMQTIEKSLRNSYLKELKEKHKLPIRQIERLTGINRGIIQKA